MIKSALLVNDDPEQGKIWANLLRQTDLDVATIGFANGDWDDLQDKGFDVMVVITRGNQTKGINFCRRVRSEFTNPILLLSPRRDEDHVLEGYTAGIDECIPTSIDPRLFIAKLRAWLRRSWTVAAVALDPIQAGKFHLDPERRQLMLLNGACVKLTNLEFRVLYLLMSHLGKALETKFITQRVWGYSAEDESVVLKNVIYRLRRKIEQDPASPSYIRTIPGLGYSLDAD